SRICVGGRYMIPSLRARLTFVTAVATAAAVVIAMLALYVAIRGALYSEFDRGLEAKAYGLSALIEWNDGHVVVENDERMQEQFERSDHPDSFQAWLKSGDIIAKSPSTGHNVPEQPTAEFDHRFEEVLLPNGEPGRAVTFSFYPHLPAYELEEAGE